VKTRLNLKNAIVIAKVVKLSSTEGESSFMALTTVGANITKRLEKNMMY